MLPGGGRFLERMDFSWEDIDREKGLLIATGEAIPLRGLEAVPGLPGAPQDEAGTHLCLLGLS